jgi:hypothetical protein
LQTMARKSPCLLPRNRGSANKNRGQHRAHLKNIYADGKPDCYARALPEGSAPIALALLIAESSLKHGDRRAADHQPRRGAWLTPTLPDACKRPRCGAHGRCRPGAGANRRSAARMLAREGTPAARIGLPRHCQGDVRPPAVSRETKPPDGRPRRARSVAGPLTPPRSSARLPRIGAVQPSWLLDGGRSL